MAKALRNAAVAGDTAGLTRLLDSGAPVDCAGKVSLRARFAHAWGQERHGGNSESLQYAAVGAS